MTTFADIFKKSFLEEAGDLTIEKFVLSMLVAFICGMIVFAVYRNFYRGVIYNNNFNILLVISILLYILLFVNKFFLFTKKAIGDGVFLKITRPQLQFLFSLAIMMRLFEHHVFHFHQTNLGASLIFI